VKALAQPTKSAFLFVLNRETGEPIWPIEERPVPQSDVPKEKSSPTQPFPTRPCRSIAGRHRERPDGSDAGAQGEALEVVKRYKMGRSSQPPVVSSLDGPLGTLQLPSEVGGANWPGGSMDPEGNYLYIHSHCDRLRPRTRAGNRRSPT
jgi:quinoprotein glucose dehydrogenase